MPGKSHLRSLDERIMRTLRANTTRTVGGLGSNASPGMTRDRLAAASRGSSALGTQVRASKVDDWDIVNTATSSFTLSKVPIAESWNLELNGLRVHRDDFSITGRTLTIVAPAVLFKAVATQAPPWNLEIQYDYLAGVPKSPVNPATFPQSVAWGDEAPNPTIPLAAPPAAGASVLLVWRSKYGGAITSVSGLGATWTRLRSTAIGPQEVWLGTGCNGVGSTVSLVSNEGLSTQVVESSTPLTASGPQFTEMGAGTAISLAAAVTGVAILAQTSGAGYTLVPAGGWAAVNSSNFSPTVTVRATSAGETVGATGAGFAWSQALVGVVKYA